MQFKDLGIETTIQNFIGDKIKMEKILNKEISIAGFKIGDSKAFPEKGNGKYMNMQIEVGGEKRVVFTGSRCLMDTIQKVPESSFPFTTTIVKENDHYQFT